MTSQSVSCEKGWGDCSQLWLIALFAYRFLIGREKEGVESEVARLINESLEMDKTSRKVCFLNRVRSFDRVNNPTSVWLYLFSACVSIWRGEEPAEMRITMAACQRGARWRRKRRKMRRRMCQFFPVWTATSSASSTSRYFPLNINNINIHKAGVRSKVYTKPAVGDHVWDVTSENISQNLNTDTNVKMSFFYCKTSKCISFHINYNTLKWTCVYFSTLSVFYSFSQNYEAEQPNFTTPEER